MRNRKGVERLDGPIYFSPKIFDLRTKVRTKTLRKLYPYMKQKRITNKPIRTRHIKNKQKEKKITKRRRRKKEQKKIYIATLSTMT
jgi:hypothetical protein